MSSWCFLWGFLGSFHWWPLIKLFAFDNSSSMCLKGIVWTAVFWSFLFSYCFFHPFRVLYIYIYILYIYIQLKSSPMTKNLPSDRPKLPLKKRTGWRPKQQSKACNWIIRFITGCIPQVIYQHNNLREIAIHSPRLLVQSAWPHPQQIIVRFNFSWEVCI